MEPITGWDENADVVLVNLGTGKLAAASLNGRYEGKVSVDQRTGEIIAGCLTCTEKEHLVRRLERRIRGLELQIDQMRQDQEAKAKRHTRWSEMVELFGYWARHCRHPRSKLTADRFWAALPFLERHGMDLCKRAIDGAAYDPWTVRRKNGSEKRFDDWLNGRSGIFDSAGRFEEFVNRAPVQTA